MQRPKRITLAPSALDADGVALSQTPAAGGVQSLTLAGALVTNGVAIMGTGQHITVASDGIDTTRVFTISGTDWHGTAITETITGVNAGTVAGVKNFKTVTGVTVDDDTAGAITVGVNGVCESQWVPLDIYDEFNVGIGVVLNPGVLTYTVEHTFDDVFATGFEPSTAATFNHATLAAQSSSADGSYVSPPVAVRLAISAYTSGSAILQIVSTGDGY
jgi:hypothetical protein